MKTRTKLGLILGLAYVIDKFTKPIEGKELELKNEDAPKFEFEDPLIWKKKQKQSSPFADKGIKYHVKARSCKDEVKAGVYYKKSIDNWNEVVKITHDNGDYSHLLTICWESNLIEEVEKHLNEWLKEFPNDSDAHGNLARLFESKKDVEKAKSEYLLAVSLNQRNYHYCEALSEIYLREGDSERAIEAYKKPLEYISDDVDSGIHCGLYERYIMLSLDSNKINSVLKLIPEIFAKLDDLISGKCKPRVYQQQEAWFYINNRKKFGKKIGEILGKRIKADLKNDAVPKAKEFLESFIGVLQNIKSNGLHLMLNILKARIFRKERKFNESWALYNQSLPFCEDNKDLSLLYADMGAQLVEEKKLKDSIGMFLLSLSFTEKFTAANSGLKKALKLDGLTAHYESLIDIAKSVKDYEKLKESVKSLYVKAR